MCERESLRDGICSKSHNLDSHTTIYEINLDKADVTTERVHSAGYDNGMIGLMPKVGMPIFGKCQMLASDWLATNFSSQPYKKLPTFGKF